jgi:hypothetical protein
MAVDWDAALKIWGVVGPLAAGAASAIWSRRNQLRDRADEAHQREVARRNELEDRRLESERNLILAQRTELRTSIAQFVAAANEFLTVCSANRSGEGSEHTKKLELDASARMNSHFQNLQLICNDAVGKAASRVLNLATEFPTSAARWSDDEKADHKQRYFVAKKELTSAARELLGVKLEA